MDIPRFVRRMSSYGTDENNNNMAAVTPANMISRPGSGLTVDTSVAKNSFRKINSLERNKSMEPQWGSLPNNGSGYGLGDETPTPTSRQTTPSSTRSEDHEQSIRRRRSNSECLLLAKTSGVQDLPGPCKEYISSVKQILARSEEKGPTQRRRSMSMRNNPVLNEQTIN